MSRAKPIPAIELLQAENAHLRDVLQNVFEVWTEGAELDRCFKRVKLALQGHEKSQRTQKRKETDE